MPNIQYDNNGMPIYRQSDGWKSYDEFQAAALNDMEDTAKKAGKPIMQPATGDFQPIPQSSPNGTPIGRTVSDILPAVGAGAGAMIPGADITGLPEIGGAAVGTALKNYLRSNYPSTFGQNPSTATGRAADISTDIGLASIPALGPIAKIAGSIGSKLPVVGRAAGALIDEMPQLSSTAQQAVKTLLRSIQIGVKAQPSSQNQNK